MRRTHGTAPMAHAVLREPRPMTRSGCRSAGINPSSLQGLPKGTAPCAMPFKRMISGPSAVRWRATTPEASSATTTSSGAEPWSRAQKRSWPGTTQANRTPAAATAAARARRREPALLAASSPNTEPAAISSRSVPGVPSTVRRNRPVSRLPRTQPTMLAVGSRPRASRPASARAARGVAGARR